MTPAPVLLPADFESRQLEAVRALIEARLARHRIDNDAHTDERKTAARRGRIAEAKEILALVTAPAPNSAPASQEPGAFVGESPIDET